MQKLRVSGYVGHAQLAHASRPRRRREKGLNLRKDLFLEVAFVTGERLSEKIRGTAVEKKYDIIMRQGYGTADVGCIGYECFQRNGLHISNRCFVEICHPDTGIPLKDGEVGEVVVTSFNKTYPLIRLATGDLSYIDRAPCSCGRRPAPASAASWAAWTPPPASRGCSSTPIRSSRCWPASRKSSAGRSKSPTPAVWMKWCCTSKPATSGVRTNCCISSARTHQAAVPNCAFLPRARCLRQIKPIEDKREWD